MRRLRLLFALLLATTGIGACASSAAHPAGSPESWQQDESEIRTAIQASAAAWNRGDLRGHLSFYVDSVTFMTQSGPRPGVAAVEEAFRNTYFSGGAPRQNLRFEQITIRPLDDDAALATGRFILSGGNEPEQFGWFTLVWVQTPDGWRAVHDHSS